MSCAHCAVVLNLPVSSQRDTSRGCVSRENDPSPSGQQCFESSNFLCTTCQVVPWTFNKTDHPPLRKYIFSNPLEQDHSCCDLVVSSMIGNDHLCPIHQHTRRQVTSVQQDHLG